MYDHKYEGLRGFNSSQSVDTFVFSAKYSIYVTIYYKVKSIAKGCRTIAVFTGLPRNLFFIRYRPRGRKSLSHNYLAEKSTSTQPDQSGSVYTRSVYVVHIKTTLDSIGHNQ